MKRIILSALVCTCFSFLYAQPGKPVVKKPVTSTPVPVLKTTIDSLSYILGESAAYNLMQQGFGDVKLNIPLYTRAMNDIFSKKKPLLDDMVANTMINQYYMKMQEEKSKGDITAGQKFLAQNKLKPGVITTASGLQYEVITQGTGIKITLIDTFVVNYRGTLLDGTVFDASANRGQPLTMALSDVINGWKEGMQLMPVGSKYKFYIPYNLGYGTQGQGQIPGGAMLTFDLELLDVKKRQ